MTKQIVLYVEGKSHKVDVGGVLTVTYQDDRDEQWIKKFIEWLECEFTVRRTDPRDMKPLQG